MECVSQELGTLVSTMAVEDSEVADRDFRVDS
jgi:hypothetical protein